MTPKCEETYKFRDIYIAPSIIRDRAFKVKSFNKKTRLFGDNVYQLIVEMGHCYNLEVLETVWENFVRPASWFIETGYYTVSMKSLDIAYANDQTLAKMLTDRREPFYISVSNDNMDGFVRFNINPSMFSTHTFKIPVELFHAIFTKYKNPEGAVYRAQKYTYGPKFHEPVRSDFGPMKTVSPVKSNKVSVKFDFKNDKERLDAIEFLQKMRVHND